MFQETYLKKGNCFAVNGAGDGINSSAQIENDEMFAKGLSEAYESIHE